MNISQQGIAAIKRLEGCKLSAYKDMVGVWTIGYGFTDGIMEGMVITQKQADEMLMSRIRPYESAITDACTVKPSQSQFDAMVCLTWNIGIGAFQKSSVLRLHNQGKFKEAANAFGLWNKAKVGGKLVMVSGLVMRRASESAMYLQDDESARDMPQVVNEPPTMTTSNINIAQGAAGVTASLAAIQPIIDAINAFKSGVETLGQWAIPLALIGIVGLCAYTIWQRVQLRNRGQA